MASKKAPKGTSVDQLVKKVQTDKLFRARLVSRLADALEDLGVDPNDINLIPSLEESSEDLAGGSTAQIVIIHRSDSKKNSKSIIIAGRKGIVD